MAVVPCRNRGYELHPLAHLCAGTRDKLSLPMLIRVKGDG
jgi:hypothetical protein